ncbi:hypothetical protein MVEN_01363800 [Mycena venus]|uniref:Uncharacterized protein n=1 Tax=Mycena venus TaxID=2733690 RepID=A0A8H6XWK3_9AGAR|nr:hypothetical protein MVEN_01363800 [Mycena venus]
MCPNTPKKLVDTLDKCIPIWKRMAHVEMPHNLGNRSTIISALSQAPNLGTLVVWDPHNWMNRIPPYIRTISTNSTLKHIQIKPTVPPTDYHFPRRKALYDEVQKDTKLKALWDFENERVIPTDDEIPSSAIEPPSSPFVYPARLASDPMAEDVIWERVLYFALRDVSERKRQFFESDRWDDDQDDDDLCDLAPFRLAPLLACKKFARLGVPHLYERPVLQHSWAVESFASQLAQQPLLGRRVRCLSINHGSDVAVFKRIIAQTPSLTELRGGRACRPMTWKAFSDLGKSSGSSLRSFGGIPISKASGAVNPDMFALFPQIKDFGWDTWTEFKIQPKLIPTDAFGQLVDLTVDRFDGSFLDVLAQMELPSLRTAAFPATARGDGAQFFKIHGAKLQELTLSERQIEDPELAIWHNCPSLTVLGVCYDKQHPVRSSCLKTSETHAYLERIVFRAKEFQRLTQPQKIELGQLMTALRSTASFPALREIQHPSCNWPTTEHEIKSSRWVKWAESLLERDVHLFGPNGVRWRPRLKFVTKNKQ